MIRWLILHDFQVFFGSRMHNLAHLWYFVRDMLVLSAFVGRLFSSRFSSFNLYGELFFLNWFGMIFRISSLDPGPNPARKLHCLFPRCCCCGLICLSFFVLGTCSDIILGAPPYKGMMASCPVNYTFMMSYYHKYVGAETGFFGLTFVSGGNYCN